MVVPPAAGRFAGELCRIASGAFASEFLIQAGLGVARWRWPRFRRRLKNCGKEAGCV